MDISGRRRSRPAKLSVLALSLPDDSPVRPAIKVFLSYAHADDDVLELIEPFSKSLKQLAFADRGRVLEIFVDRTSIDWGEDWEDRIHSSILGAMVFMPIVTRQYFDRLSCREELLRFNDEARRLNVEALLLPVLVMGKNYIAADSPDVAARIIDQRQYRDVKEAWIEGPGSPVWRRIMMKLAGEVVDAVELAEQNLTVTKTAPSPATPTGDRDDDDAPGAAEVLQALTPIQTGIRTTIFVDA